MIIMFSNQKSLKLFFKIIWIFISIREDFHLKISSWNFLKRLLIHNNSQIKLKNSIYLKTW
jgi:hypothetical protein